MKMKIKADETKKKGWVGRFLAWFIKGQERVPGKLCGQ
jgi:hypothetical protein